jgi:hypothetical protein
MLKAIPILLSTRFNSSINNIKIYFFRKKLIYCKVSVVQSSTEERGDKKRKERKEEKTETKKTNRKKEERENTERVKTGVE